jgi:hypothetical protein
MKKLFLLAACLGAGIGASAADVPSRVKIDIDGRDASIPFKIVSTSNGLRGLYPAWIKEPDKKQTYMIFQGTADLSPDQWTDQEFTFVPEKDGAAVLTLRSAIKTTEFWGWTAYRNVEMSGAEFNGIWRVRPEMLRKTPEGDIFYAAHDASAIRGLKLTAGQEVKIRFQAQGAPSLKAKEMPVKPDPLDTVPPMRAADNMPKEYYYYFDKDVKLLPLKDKGLSGEHIARHLRDAGRKTGRELPQPQFLATTLAGTPNKPVEFSVPVELLEEAGVARNAAVRFGFPLPKGHFFEPGFLKVLDPSGKEVPAQFSFLGTWPDSSAKWVLVQFAAPLKANEKAVYRVASGKPAAPAAGLTVRPEGDGYLVSTGPLTVTVDGRLFSSVVSNGRKIGGLEPLKLVMENGDIAEALPGKITIEEQGPEVLQFRLDGKLGTIADYVARLRFYRGSAAVYGEISYINTNLKNEFTDFTSLTLDFRTAGAVSAFSVDGDSSLKRYFQEDERTLNGKPGKMSGAAAVKTAAGNFNVAIRDAALRYPKALSAAGDRISLELLPEQPSPEFGKKLPYYLQFPFVDGKYRMKWGMAFTEKFCFDFSGSDAAVTVAETSLPVVAVIDRDWHFHTGAIQGASAANDHSFDNYDRQMREAVKEHLMFKARQREFGFLNYGDWFGERSRNWGNNEYDLAHGMFVHFIRTGNRDAARLASAAAQHQADVDIVQAYPDPYYIGANAQHGVGHTGTNYQHVDRGSWTHRYDYSYTAENGHTWSQGMVEEWLLNGNARVMSSALKLGEHICWFMVPNFKQLGSHERSGGWSMTALMGLYNGINDPLYLDSAAKIAKLAMDEQNFEKGGAWPHVLPLAHAGGQKDAYGNCPYLIGVLLEGLGKYHAVTGDPRAKKAIIAGAEWLVKAWSPNEQSWPYGVSWDGKAFNAGAPNLNLLIAPAVIYAGNLADSADMFKIASDVMTGATFKGMDATGKALSLDVATVAGLIDGLSRWNFKHPDRPYKYDASHILSQAFAPESMRFSLRAPDRKSFKVVLKKDNPEIRVARVKAGARPKGRETGTLALSAADGKVLLQEEYPASAPFAKKYPVTAKAGETITVDIDDDMTAVWDVETSPDYDAFAMLVANSSMGDVNNKGFYFTVPAGASEFTIHVRGVHPGKFNAQIIDEKGQTVESIEGINVGSSRLPWLTYDSSADPVQKRTVKFAPSSEPRNWRLLVSAAGNISFYFEGIPSAVSIAPGFFPAKL